MQLMVDNKSTINVTDEMSEHIEKQIHFVKRLRGEIDVDRLQSKSSGWFDLLSETGSYVLRQYKSSGHVFW